jgi:ADP-dependent phosphofructokinase/glucokinase
MAIIFHVEITFIQKNRVENTILAKLLQNTELAVNSMAKPTRPTSIPL